jgi:hypothetical protein
VDYILSRTHSSSRRDIPVCLLLSGLYQASRRLRPPPFGGIETDFSNHRSTICAILAILWVQRGRSFEVSVREAPQDQGLS